MQTCRPWDWGKRDGALSLTIRFLVGGRGLSLRLSPFVIVLGLGLLIGSAYVGRGYLATKQDRQTAELAELKLQNEQLKSLMVHKEKEREQMVKLAEARSEELWLELDSRDQELAKLWKLVGKKPKSASTMSSGHKVLLSSRSGLGQRSTIEVKRRYRSLMTKIRSSETELASLSEAAKDYRQKRLEEYRARLASRTPDLWPCHGSISSPYGYRIHPIYGAGRFHSGCDIAASMGTDIRATAAGTVIASGWMGGYGNAIEVAHGGGLTTLYGHCSALLVPVGAQVRKGELIAKVGSTGASTGPHCHYEVRIAGETTDPWPYLKEKDAPKPVANL